MFLACGKDMLVIYIKLQEDEGRERVNGFLLEREQAWVIKVLPSVLVCSYLALRNHLIS